MIPYSKNFCEEKIREYKTYIKPDRNGEYSIEYSKNNIFDGYLYDKLEELKEAPIELKYRENLWMRISPHEIQGCFQSIEKAYGKVGVLGLGLGYFTQEVAKKENVSEIIVYEISKEVIELYKNNFSENSKIKIINEDGFKAKSEIFDFFFVDIYQYKLSIDVVEHYQNLMKLHNINEYSFWGVEHFLLSCPLHKIVWVYIPEIWMNMSKELFSIFSQTEYIESFSPIEEKEALNILEAFDKIL